MKITDEEFKRLPYPVWRNIDYRKKYKELNKVLEIKNYRNLDYPFDKVFGYVVLIYSVNTPMLAIADHRERKVEAARLAGLNLSDEKLIELVTCKIEPVNRVILAYLRLQKNFKWSKLCGFIDSFYHQLARLQAGDTDAEKTKDLLTNISKTEDEIEKTLNDILNGDKDGKDIVLTKIEEDKVEDLRPEVVALKGIKYKKKNKVDNEGVDKEEQLSPAADGDTV